ncbi:CynX/NimT family MFS transporter [Schaalia vaccimaxillae]|uniref:MFS transporter n=1 Tax=Schaalia vaccimaxillae TaxID=183916 RepID=UPI0003B612DE|nr:MFS transporter [Schaalia vaccimaxillae]
MPDGQGQRRASGQWDAWRTLVAATILLCLCLLVRAPLNIVPPLLTRIGDDLAMDEVALGALTAVPVLCFGFLTPLGSAWVKRLGPNTSALVFLVLLVVGAIIRSSSSVWMLFAGTIIMGLGTAIANVVIPMIIGRDFATRAALMTGLYTVASNIGVTVVTGVAVPTAQAIGWKGATLAWSLAPTLLMTAAWIKVFPPRRPPKSDVTQSNDKALSTSAPAVKRQPVWKMRTALALAAAFGGHTFVYYSFASWLPTMLADLRSMTETDAGLAATVFHVTGIIGSLLPPFMRRSFGCSTATVLLAVSALWLAMPIGLLLAPTLWPLCSLCCGMGHGALFTALFTLVIEHSQTIDINRRVVAFVQSVGYLIAAVGPIFVGWLYSRSGTWMAPLLTLIVSLLVMTVSSQIAARGRIDLTEEGA